MGKVYKGDQSFREFIRLQDQGILFDVPMDASKAQERLNVLATKIITEFGRDLEVVEQKETLKERARNRCIVFDGGMIATALDFALRERRQ